MGTAIFLFIIGIILIVFNVKAIKKDKNTFNNILMEREKNVGSYDLEIGKLRKEFAETLVEIQSEVVKLQEKMDKQQYKENNFIESKNNVKNEIADKDNKNKYDKEKDEDKFILQNKKETIDKLHKKNSSTSGKENSKTEKESNNKKELNSKNSSNHIKPSEIKELLEKGLNIEEISDKLKINKGEILLIKELYLK